MAKLQSPPPEKLSYDKYLIGEEIAMRALEQQKNEHIKDTTSRPWSNDLRAESGRVLHASSILRDLFDIDEAKYPNHCQVSPPCPWAKDSDDVKQSQLKNIIMEIDGVYRYEVKIVEGHHNDGVGATIANYKDNPNLPNNYPSDSFFYLEKNIDNGTYRGDATFVIDQFALTSSGSSDAIRRFVYKFNLTN